ncbi:NAD(P)-binding domain-containing protein [Paraburkholderia monticola]|nr:NAD(P)-binding domain-containing protein [Paraburkholderia monticola]
MTYSTIGSSGLGAALARQFGCSGIAVGIANTRGPESIETIAKQLASQVTAMTQQGVLSKDLLLVAVPLRTNSSVDAKNTDDISPDELIGLLNIPR